MRGAGINAFHSRQSLYLGPGIGVRVFPRQPHHGVIVDMQYSFDTDLDSINVDVGSWRTDFVLARVGYGYRFIKHANEKITWAFTPHGSLSTGASINRTANGELRLFGCSPRWSRRRECRHPYQAVLHGLGFCLRRPCSPLSGTAQVFAVRRMDPSSGVPNRGRSRSAHSVAEALTTHSIRPGSLHRCRQACEADG